MNTQYEARSFSVLPRRLLTLCLLAGVISSGPGADAVFAQPARPSAKQPAAKRPKATLGELLRKSSNDELSRGVLQRPSMFLNITGTKKHLQIALVLDGTDSMGQELTSVQKNLAAFAQGVRANKGEESTTSFALVIYRDKDAPSGPVTVAVSEFTEDVTELDKALKAVKTETGQPYFNELVDVGLHTAMTKLNWMPRNRDAEVTRWVVVCGDAPPYPEGARQHSVEELSKLAREQGIEVNGVLCNSGFLRPGPKMQDLLKVAEEQLPASRDFLTTLAKNSGGKFFDMWDEDAVQRIIDDGRAKMQFVQRMRSIQPEDVQSYRSEQEQIARSETQAAPVKPVRVAVLPFARPGNMTFAATSQSARAATEVREQLRRLPGVEVRSPVDVETAFKATSDKFTNDEQGVAAMADKLDVDYVVWGDINADGSEVNTQLRRTLDGALLSKIASKPKKAKGWTTPKIKPEEPPADFPPALSANSGYEPLSNERPAQESLLTALDLLERSLAYRKFDNTEESLRLLTESETHLKRALRHDPENAFAHLLLANCYFNLSRMDETDDYVSLRYSHLGKALRYGRKRPETDPLRREIEADYALLAQKKFRTAIEGYQSLADPYAPGNSQYALRANWMLAGLYLGDFGLQEVPTDAEAIVNLDKAREHILCILAFWPNSPQAAFYEKCISQAEKGMMMIDVGTEAVP